MIADGPLTERSYHLATWTGTEMLIWGGHRKNYIEPPDGAAYDPRTDRWREIADGPLEWHANATGIWTGREWVIAATDSRAERTDFAAYDPASDGWRSLPSLAAEGGTEKDFAWTGEQLVLREQGGTFQRLPVNGGAWIAVEPVPGGFPVIGPIHWTGQEVVGTAIEFLGTDEPRYRGHLVAWNPATEGWNVLASSTSFGGFLVSAGERAILLGGGLAYDPASRSLWSMPTPGWADLPEDAVIVWAGDRLFIWGGGIGHPPMSYEDGLVLTPDW